jgi:membrane associated rhomboid family serine protease
MACIYGSVWRIFLVSGDGRYLVSPKPVLSRGASVDPTSIIILIALLNSFFLFPIKDHRKRKRGFTWMTVIIVFINVLIHIWVSVTVYWQPAVLPDEPAWLAIYPFMEVAELKLNAGGLGALSSLTSFFLHADFSHLLGNMFVLWFFGRKVEDATGPWRFLLFYLLCGFTANFVSVLANASLSPIHARMPGLGASGAISGLMGAYLFLYSEEKILTLFSFWLNPIVPALSGCFIVIPIPFWLPAWIYLAYYFLRDALMAQFVVEMATQDTPFVYGVGVFAHLGGALGGLALIYFFIHPDVMAKRR